MEFNGGLEEFCLVVDLDMLATSLEVSSVWFPIHDLYLPKRGRLETPLRSENQIKLSRITSRDDHAYDHIEPWPTEDRSRNFSKSGCMNGVRWEL